MTAPCIVVNTLNAVFFPKYLVCRDVCDNFCGYGTNIHLCRAVREILASPVGVHYYGVTNKPNGAKNRAQGRYMLVSSLRCGSSSQKLRLKLWRRLSHISKNTGHAFLYFSKVIFDKAPNVLTTSILSTVASTPRTAEGLTNPAADHSCNSVSPGRKGGDMLLVIAATINFMPALLKLFALRTENNGRTPFASDRATKGYVYQNDIAAFKVCHKRHPRRCPTLPVTSGWKL
jgi:hypothetical protein